MSTNYPLPYTCNSSHNITAATGSKQNNGQAKTWLKMIMAFSLLSVQHPLHAENSRVIANLDKVFYQQLIVIESDNNNGSIAPPHFQAFIDEQPANSETVNFNHLWIQQHQPEYRHKDGGAAVGRLLRMSVIAFYRNHYGSNSFAVAHAEEDFNGDQTNLAYRLRVSGNEMKLDIEYEF